MRAERRPLTSMMHHGTTAAQFQQPHAPHLALPFPFPPPAPAAAFPLPFPPAAAAPPLAPPPPFAPFPLPLAPPFSCCLAREIEE